MNSSNKKTILLVDDDKVIALGTAQVLRNIGYEVVIANSGEEAVSIAEGSSGIDLVLMDIDLGKGIDGTEAATRILGIRELPVVFFSSHAEPEIVERTERITSYGYIVKNSTGTVLDASIKMAFKLFEANAKVKAELAERMRAEEALRESETRLLSLSDNLPGGLIYQIDSGTDGTQRRFTYLGAGVASLHGITVEEGMADAAAIYGQVLEEDRARVVEKERAALAKMEVLNVEVRVRLPDGELKWRLFTSAPRLLENGHLVWDGIEIDITERKLAEVERSRQLAEKEFLLKEVHHRIKNNIASIESLLSIQSAAVANPEAAAALRDAIARVGSMRVLYEKLLVSEDYSILQVGAYITSIVDTAVSLFPGRGGISIEKRIDDFALPSKSAFALGIVVNELLNNSMKHAFTDGDKGSILISLRREGTMVTLSVHDDGRGVPDDFDRAAAKGFGLTLVHMLCGQLGGTISVERDGGTKSVLSFVF